jgi:hypothetical protein
LPLYLAAAAPSQSQSGLDPAPPISCRREPSRANQRRLPHYSLRIPDCHHTKSWPSKPLRPLHSHLLLLVRFAPSPVHLTTFFSLCQRVDTVTLSSILTVAFPALFLPRPGCRAPSCPRRAGSSDFTPHSLQLHSIVTRYRPLQAQSPQQQP